MPLAIVTTGPSSEPIDEVRCITNSATGHIGALLSEALVHEGFHVALFRGKGATHRDVPSNADLHEFRCNNDLAAALATLSGSRLNDVRAVFHAAALSDFSLAEARGPAGERLSGHKIPSDLSEVRLTLRPATKVLPRLRPLFPSAWIVGWKFEMDGTRINAVEAGRRQIARGETDATIVNGNAYGDGFGFLEDGNSPVHFANRRELAYFLASRAAKSANPHG